MHHSTQSTVMEGVLASTVTLGVCKSTCDLLSLSTVGASLNSICFCCGCLLIFTDLTVTAFLALLWLAEPWLPLFPVPSDVITLRFLLFLGHTYGAVLLLTVPLIAMETACKLLLVPPTKSQADRWGPRDGGSEGRREGEGVETGGGWPAVQGDSDAGDRAEALLRFSPVPGFLCSLLAWALCGLWGGQQYVLELPEVEACIQRAGSLSQCLPDLATITQSASSDPSLTLPALILLLALPVSLSMLRIGRTKSEMRRPARYEGIEALHKPPAACSRAALLWAAIKEEAPHVHTAGMQPRSLQPTPTPATHSPCLSTESDWEQSPKAIRCGRVNMQMLCDPCQRTVAAHTHPPSRSSALCGPAGPETHTRSSCRTLGLSLLVGLLSAVALYLLPPCLAVNPILISSMGSLAERSLKH
ncbi:hypothetical protein SKAU_G00158550 [Synaphobranchus kaupii]|uniref:Uncharacterized protein n=1 Tax=Synaphobranchus kaupii TaxID=118154 RepID=A0A9Q1FIL9_SYNKA|nr:hypothetical protein SKAU_G00158550 [Synaphobranchus kaupii]